MNTPPLELIMTVTARVNPYDYLPPQNRDEIISFANANGYLWGHQDATLTHARALREAGHDPAPAPAHVPDGWSYAWLEYNRRTSTSRMSIQDAFRMWCQQGTLPSLAPPHQPSDDPGDGHAAPRDAE